MYKNLESYRSNRSHYVVQESFASKRLEISRGFPQGSVLDALLFLLHKLSE